MTGDATPAEALILHRLDVIEGQLREALHPQVVERDLAHVRHRVELLEAASAEQAKSRRTMHAGIIAALVVPTATYLLRALSEAGIVG